MTNPSQLAHHVFFSLVDASPDARQAMVEQCFHWLAEIDGIVSFSAGTREGGLDREVNDAAFDVSLHVLFRDREAHDAYQSSQGHLDFIESNKDKWSQVRVFDSLVRSAGVSS